MRAVDTNVLVRLIVQDNKAQQAAAESFVASGAWVSHLVLAETVWVLDTVYGLDHTELIKAIAMLQDQAQLVIQEPDVVSAALDHFRRKPSVEFSDCLIFEIARKAGHLPLGTFDRKLAKLAGAEAI
jgi:predicted nucleic-acid-binding protein